ncbi:hypothetical protein V6N13_047831 [Hibiscus sabdariffa]|uniref:Uncharacterized protein n=1 Tax=Hibiscus sabdariffa TaxID=183260 RepID=A0ABR2F5D9_9ROSI
MQLLLPRPPCLTWATLCSMIRVPRSYDRVSIPRLTPLYQRDGNLVQYPVGPTEPDAAYWNITAAAEKKCDYEP